MKYIFWKSVFLGGFLFVHLRRQTICGEYWCKNLAELEPYTAIKTRAIKMIIRNISKGIYSLCLQRPYLVRVQSQCKKWLKLLTDIKWLLRSWDLVLLFNIKKNNNINNKRKPIRSSCTFWKEPQTKTKQAGERRPSISVSRTHSPGSSSWPLPPLAPLWGFPPSRRGACRRRSLPTSRPSEVPAARGWWTCLLPTRTRTRGSDGGREHKR